MGAVVPAKIGVDIEVGAWRQSTSFQVPMQLHKDKSDGTLLSRKLIVAFRCLLDKWRSFWSGGRDRTL